MIPVEGEWRVDRIGNPLPPMADIRKRIHGNFGETQIGPLPIGSFRCERKEWGVALIYLSPVLGVGGRNCDQNPMFAGWGARRCWDWSEELSGWSLWSITREARRT
jgi:hypothetical protein